MKFECTGYTKNSPTCNNRELGLCRLAKIDVVNRPTKQYTCPRMPLIGYKIHRIAYMEKK